MEKSQSLFCFLQFTSLKGFLWDFLNGKKRRSTVDLRGTSGPLLLFLQGCICCCKRNVMRKFKTFSQLWHILIQVKMWPIKETKNSCSYIVAKSYPLQQAVGMRRYGSPINIKPSDFSQQELETARSRDVKKVQMLGALLDSKIRFYRVFDAI